MSEYPFGSIEDRKMLAKMPIEKLLDYFFFADSKLMES